jgi:hypothetical protein
MRLKAQVCQPVWVGPSVAPPVWSGDGTGGVATHRTAVTVNLW